MFQPPISKGPKKFKLELFWWCHCKMAARFTQKLPKSTKVHQNRSPDLFGEDGASPCSSSRTGSSPTMPPDCRLKAASAFAGLLSRGRFFAF